MFGLAVIHHTVLTPTKLELLASWLPTRSWYVGGHEPELAKAGGFRLDDPSGAVGIEFLVLNDVSGAQPATYLVPLSYRGAPLDGAEHALVGTMEHGVLGRRWAYDGCHDPVLVAQLLALIEGKAQAQDKNLSDTPDREISRGYVGDGLSAVDFTAPAVDHPECTQLSAPHGAALSLHRILRPAPDGIPDLPAGVIGHVAGPWCRPDGTAARGVFVVLHAA